MYMSISFLSLDRKPKPQNPAQFLNPYTTLQVLLTPYRP